MKKTICGVDVSKAKLDVCIESGHRPAKFNSHTAGVELAAFCREHAVIRVVMEASGGYERRAFVELWQKGISGAVTNPRNVRRYAYAMGVLEQTDRIDSPVIARFAHAKNLAPTRCRASPQQRPKVFVARLRQVTDDLTVQKQRRASILENAEVRSSIDRVIALLKRQSRKLKGEIASMIDDDPLWAKLAETWRGTRGRPAAPSRGCMPSCRKSAPCATRPLPSWSVSLRLPTAAASAKANVTPAAAVPASARSSSLSRPLSPTTTNPGRLPQAAGRFRKGKDGHSYRARPQAPGSHSRPKHATREPPMPMQLDSRA